MAMMLSMIPTVVIEACTPPSPCWPDGDFSSIGSSFFNK